MPLPALSPTGVLYVMATTQEFGAALRQRIDPVITGVGPVEAAIATTLALASLRDAAALPRLVVSLGSAGSRTLPQLGVFQASSVSYRDMDASALGFERGLTPFLDLPAALEIETRIPGVTTSSLSTGANIVSGSAYDSIAAEMVDMESYAVLRACQAFAVPLVVLRGISDGVAELSGLADWTRYLDVIDEKLAAIVDIIEQQ
jgi:adenosylhomocysteine nucleosidase